LLGHLEKSGRQVGLYIVRAELKDPQELIEMFREGMTAILVENRDRCLLLTGNRRSRFDASLIENGLVQSVRLKRSELASILNSPEYTLLCVKPLQDCDPISSRPVYQRLNDIDIKRNLSPVRRLLALMRMERSDIGVIAIFAVTSSILSLVTPLVAESLINVVSWGIYLQPLIVMVLALLGALVLSAIFNVMQYVIVEILQRRQFVRIVSDLAHRFPQVNRQSLDGEFPRELANRVFDILTIQKSTAVLLLDGLTIIVVTVIGLLLLGFYHVYLLGFVFVLLFAMTAITWWLGRGGMATSIAESKTKYQMVHWLQDVLDSPSAFRVNGGSALAVDNANTIALKYVTARKEHFKVLIRQIIFAAGLQSFALAYVFGVGGWLVMQGAMNLGQWVAAELVVTLVVGAFSKAGKSFEKIYDILAALDKVGHLLDLPTDLNEVIHLGGQGALPVGWNSLRVEYGTQVLEAAGAQIDAGSLTAVLIDQPTSVVAETLTGTLSPSQGTVTVGQVDVRQLAVAAQQGRTIALASSPEVFHDSLANNIDLGRDFISLQRVRDVLRQLNLWDMVITLPEGIHTSLQSNGYPLSPLQQRKLMVARAIVAQPRVLVVDLLLDDMPPDELQVMLNLLRDLQATCTTVLITTDSYIASQCDQQIRWSQA
jgi:putative ABC transport system ATP-binding protein